MGAAWQLGLRSSNADLRNKIYLVFWWNTPSNACPGEPQSKMDSFTEVTQSVLNLGYPVALFVCYLVSSIVVRSSSWRTKNQHHDAYETTGRNAIFWLIVLLCALLVGFPGLVSLFCSAYIWIARLCGAHDSVCRLACERRDVGW